MSSQPGLGSDGSGGGRLARYIGAALTVLTMVACIVPTLAIPIAHGEMLGLFGPDLGAAVSFALVGSFLLVRVRGKVTRLAVIMCVQGVGSSLTSLSIVLFNLALLGGPLRGFDLWVAWFNSLVWVPGPVLLTPLILLYPNGTLPAPRWRALIVAVIAFGALFEVTAVISRYGEVDGLPYDAAPNPTGFIDLGPWNAGLGDIGFIGILACFAFSLGSLIVRRRRGTAVERAQLTSLLFGGSISVAVLVLVGSQANLLKSDLLLFTIELFAILPVPVAIAVAVQRYRLFAIDRIVSRTVTYTLVLAVLALIYMGVLAGFANLVPAQFGQLGVASATVLVTLLALPLARRIRNIIDRRFDRSRYDAEQVVAEFAAKLRVSPDGGGNISADVLAVVHRTLAPTTAGVWVAALAQGGTSGLAPRPSQRWAEDTDSIPSAAPV